MHIKSKKYRFRGGEVMSISEQLNQYVIQNGIKQVYISDKTGLTQDRISKILNGNRKILADEFLIICEALNIDPNIFRTKIAS